MNGAGAGAAGGRDPDHILNECRAIDRAIDDIEQELQRLDGVQQRYLADTNTSRESPLGREVDRLSQNIMTEYRGLVDRVRNIKSDRESGNPRNAPQVGKVDRRLKTTINRSQQLERDFRRRAQEQIARQYRIVRPDASDAEVQEAVEDTSNQQVFSQAVCTQTLTLSAILMAFSLSKAIDVAKQRGSHRMSGDDIKISRKSNSR